MPKKTTRKQQVTPERLMQFDFAYAPPLIVGAAVNNRVFDALQSGARTIKQLRRKPVLPVARRHSSLVTKP